MMIGDHRMVKKMKIALREFLLVEADVENDIIN